MGLRAPGLDGASGCSYPGFDTHRWADWWAGCLNWIQTLVFNYTLLPQLVDDLLLGLDFEAQFEER